MPSEHKPDTLIPAYAADVDTPALLLDLDAFDRNVRQMADFFASRPTALRPHAKTHKCPEIACRQIRAGAIGITCAKVGEAEVMVEAGLRDILIANQVVGSVKIERLTALAARSKMMVAVDDPANVHELSAACQAKNVSLRILVEVDIGMQRCGVLPGQPALHLAQHVAQAPGLRLAGLMGYEGHLVQIRDPQERRAKVLEALIPLQETRDLLERNGLPVEIVSGGGTGTYDVSGDNPPMTEIEAGSYVFMDTTYRQTRPEFEQALYVLSTIVSRPTPERLITDAGRKTISNDFGNPTPLGVPGAAIKGLSEEHGVLTLSEPGAVDLRPGDKMRFVPSHCCTTTNLYDRLYVVKDQALVDMWPIAARGRAQ